MLSSVIVRGIGARYLNLHMSEFGLGSGSLSCPQAQNVATGWIARHTAHAVRRTGPNPRLIECNRGSRRKYTSTAASSGSGSRPSAAGHVMDWPDSAQPILKGTIIVGYSQALPG